MKKLVSMIVTGDDIRRLKKAYRHDTKFNFIVNLVFVLIALLIAVMLIGSALKSGVKYSANDVNWRQWAPDGYTVELHSARAESGSNPTSFAKDMWEHYGLDEAISADFYVDIFLRINPEIRDPYKDFHAGSLYTIPVYSPLNWAEDES